MAATEAIAAVVAAVDGVGIKFFSNVPAGAWFPRIVAAHVVSLVGDLVSMPDSLFLEETPQNPLYTPYQGDKRTAHRGPDHRARIPYKKTG